ncbi:MAG: hypothetical protein IJC94_07910 [Oscillospiraceae bacterium]|nr:hypothetical protein [Oscillospiraceae bacterium]MBQ9938231.1 hypothetical protein [Oscillospiraceae bacterium]
MKTPDIWAYLIHLGSNMWNDKNTIDPYYIGEEGHPLYRDYLLCEDETWDEVVKFLSTHGFNTLLIDIGEGLAYESHPELAVKGSWSKDKLRKKLQEARAMGLEPIPKLNFSAAHDAWLQEYGQMLSTEKYLQVTADLIHEVCEVFDNPRLFHLGMDEETYNHQKHLGVAYIRNENLWWKDFYHLVEQVEKHGARAWVWSDYYWHHPDLFKKNMPKEVLQSNWYYGAGFYIEPNGLYYPPVQAYLDLNELGYDQVPTSSTWAWPGSTVRTVKFCSQMLDPDHLLGFMTAPWQFTYAGAKHALFADAFMLCEGKRQTYGL